MKVIDSSDSSEDFFNQVFVNTSSINKYNISKVNNNMLNNFGNSMNEVGYKNIFNDSKFGNLGGFRKEIYNLNLDFEKDKYKADTKKTENENVEEKKNFLENSESKNGNKFLKAIEEEIDLENNMNKTSFSFKNDILEQNQDNSKKSKEEN